MKLIQQSSNKLYKSFVFVIILHELHINNARKDTDSSTTKISFRPMFPSNETLLRFYTAQVANVACYWPIRTVYRLCFVVIF